MNRCVNNTLTQHDRAEAAKFPDVELYKQVIPIAKEGFTAFEHNGGRAVWEFYPRKQTSTKIKNFCD